MYSRNSALAAVASPTPSNDDECPTTRLYLGEVDLIELSARSEVVIRCEEESGSQVKELDMDDNPGHQKQVNGVPKGPQK
jgi:hypothetical protein